MDSVRKELLTQGEVEALGLDDTSRELILMVGLPRSGKTTFAREFVEGNAGTAIVNPDSIRVAIHGQRFIGKAEPVVWMVAKYMAQSLFTAGHHTVIIDATNNTADRRDEWVKEFRDTEVTVSCIFIFTPAAECIERARAEGDLDIIPIIEKMEEKADWLDMTFDQLEIS